MSLREGGGGWVGWGTCDVWVEFQGKVFVGQFDVLDRGGPGWGGVGGWMGGWVNEGGREEVKETRSMGSCAAESKRRCRARG